MKKVVIFLILVQISLLQYGQIIADHTVVDKYDDIPQYYIDEVKKMWLLLLENHMSMGISGWRELLEILDPKYSGNDI